MGELSECEILKRAVPIESHVFLIILLKFI
jgi:hypothetical protein